MRARTITTSKQDNRRREVSVWLSARSGAPFNELVSAILAELSAGAVGAYINLCIPSSTAELHAVERGDVAPGEAWTPPEIPAPRAEPGPMLMPREGSTITIEDEDDDAEDEEDRRGSPGYDLPDHPDDGGERDEPVMWDENKEGPEADEWEDYDFDGGPDFGEGAEDYEA